MMLNKSLKSCKKMISADIKIDVIQPKKKKDWYLNLTTFHICPCSKLELQCQTGMYFSSSLGWYSIQLDTVC